MTRTARTGAETEPAGVLLTKKNQRLGDLLAGTVVARTEIRKEPVDPASVAAFE